MKPEAPVSPYRLSKSRFISGRQCHLRLWNDTYHRDLAAAISPGQQAIFDQGTLVGELAQQRHPGGVLVEADHLHQAEALVATATLYADPAVPAIFEAAFRYEDVLIRVDILARCEGGWELIEVKSSSQCKDVYVADAALQAWVLRGCGVPLVRIGVLTLNSEYIFDGVRLNVEDLFTLHDRTEQAEAFAPAIAAAVFSQLEMLGADSAPDITPGSRCFDPYFCPYYDHCTRDVVPLAFPVGELPHIRNQGAHLKAQGFATIPEVPEEFLTNPRHRRIRQCILEQKDWVSLGLRGALEAIHYPLHHLDFETVNPAIPRHRGMQPFRKIPFQWSCHRESLKGDLTHLEFLANSLEDPREAFVTSLLEALGTEGSILVYSAFEAGVIRSLAEALPHLKVELLNLLPRLVDLLPIVRDHYYHPAFHGSYSIKSVLPALVPGRSYEGMAVSDGVAAGIAFERLVRSEDAEERARLRKDLLAYCGQDTLAMVEVRRALLARAEA